MFIGNNEAEEEWRMLVEDEKKSIMVKKADRPVECLMEMFYWSRENQDGRNLEEKFPALYKELNILYIQNEKKPLIETLQEYLENLQGIIDFFNSNKEELKKWDIPLYYAILNFMDFLKTRKGQFLFYKLKKN